MVERRLTGMTDFTKTLAALKACRDAMVDMRSRYPFRHPMHREAGWLMTDIDNLAGIITGHRDLRHDMGSSGQSR